MGTCMATFKGDKDGPVVWFGANGPESLEWQNRDSGFGYKRVVSYRDNAIEDPGYNRAGNTEGELAGKVLFYPSADQDMDYSELVEQPTVRLREGEKLFAKAFFNVPLGRIPIGENNIKHAEVRGEGAVLLASRPRAVALFVEVDGAPQTEEHFCLESKAFFDTDMESAIMEPKPTPVEKAMPGSFLTFLCSKEQEPYCFLHLPLIGSLNDTSFRTGAYGEKLIRAFTKMLANQTPGSHKVDLTVRYYYDHLDYNCLALGDGSNALGRWNRRLPNSYFKAPHETPEALETPEEPVAKGTVNVELAAGYDITSVLEQLNRKAPKERYFRKDALELRAIAKTVAGGQFCEEFQLLGLPDWVVLTSDIKTKVVTDPELLNLKHSYELIEYAALWFDEAENRKPDSPGWMVEGAMVRGEVEPGVTNEDWVWAPRVRGGTVIPSRKRPIKNKYIALAAKGRRVSIITPEGKVEFSEWARHKDAFGKLMPGVEA